MLFLTRRPRESIILRTADGTVITIFMGHTQGVHTRGGIEAPKSVSIDRAEVYYRKYPDEREVTIP